MDKRLVYTRPDDGLDVVIPAPKAQRAGESEADFLSRIAAKSVPPDAIGLRVVAAIDIPADRTFRNSWCAAGSGDPDCYDESPAVAVRMSSARSVHMDRIREVRQPELERLDVEQLRAIRANDDLETQALEAAKQVLRDLPQTFDLETALTPSEVASRWPTELPPHTPRGL